MCVLLGYWVVGGVVHELLCVGDREREIARSCVLLQCVAVCCSVLQCVAVCCSVLDPSDASTTWLEHASLLQCVAVCCGVLQFAAVCCSVLRCVAVYGAVMQCVAVCCSVLQRVAVCRSATKPSHNSHNSDLRSNHINQI